MIKLLKIELKKIKSYKAFWILIILYSVLFPLLFTGLNSIQINNKDLKESMFSAIYNFPGLWHNIAYFAGYFNVLLYLIMILLVTNEFIFKTYRQNVIDGLSKGEVLLGKLLLGVTLSLYSTLLIIIVGLISNYLFAHDTFTYNLIIEKASFVGAYLLQTIGYMTFATFIGFLFKRQGFSIIFFIIYAIMMENIVALKLPDIVAKYLPLATFDNLIRNPFASYIGSTSQESPELIYISVSILYILIFSGINLLLLEKTDT